MSAILPKSRTEAEHETYGLDVNGDTAQRVMDAETHDKLDAVVEAIENITIEVGDVTVSNEVEIKNNIASPIPVDIVSISGDLATETTQAAILGAVDQVEPKLDSILAELQDKTEPTDSQIVQATDLDIRDLAFVTDKVDVSGSTVTANATSVTQSGIITPVTPFDFDNANGYGTLIAKIDGTFTGTILFKGSVDGSTYDVNPYAATDLLALDGQIPGEAIAPGIFMFNISGLKKLRFDVVATGTANIKVTAGPGNSIITSILSPVFVEQSGGDVWEISSSTLASEATLVQVRNAVDQLEGYLDTVESLLTTLGGNTDGIEGLIGNTNTLLTTIRDNADTVETLLGGIITNTADIEVLLASTNSLLTTIRDNADTVESLLTTIDGRVDGIEGLITASNALLTTIRDNADTVETLITSTNTKLDTLINQTDTVETTLNSISTTQTNGTQQSKVLDRFGNGVDSGGSTPSLSALGLVVRNLPYQPQTYSAAASNVTFPLLATDVWNIIGSASKTIRITKLRLTGTTTSGSPINVSATLTKRSTLNTGGTRTVLTNVSHDSTNAAATANVGFYTVNPSVLGTSVGNIRAHRITFNNTGITGGDIIWDFDMGQPVILRGATEQLCINFNATTVTGNIISVSVEWQEV